MFTLRSSLINAMFIALAGCGDSGDVSTDATTAGTSGGSGTTGAPATTSGTEDGTTTSPAGTSTTHDHHTTGHATLSTETSEPTSTGEASTGESSTDGAPPPIAEYCACMLANCHDLYHETWGEDHRMSEALCAAAAEAVPSVGMPATTGDSLECRLHHCEAAADDEAMCAAAMGAAPCA